MGEETVRVRATEVAFPVGSLAQGIGELVETGETCSFLGHTGRMVEIAEAIAAGEQPEAAVPTYALRRI